MDLPYDVCALAQLYGDRDGAENVFDEPKNQRGWGSYMTQDIKRCRLIAEQFDSQAVWLRACQAITTAFTGIDWLDPFKTSNWSRRKPGNRRI